MFPDVEISFESKIEVVAIKKLTIFIGEASSFEGKGKYCSVTIYFSVFKPACLKNNS